MFLMRHPLLRTRITSLLRHKLLSCRPAVLGRPTFGDGDQELNCIAQKDFGMVKILE